MPCEDCVILKKANRKISRPWEAYSTEQKSRRKTLFLCSASWALVLGRSVGPRPKGYPDGLPHHLAYASYLTLSDDTPVHSADGSTHYGVLSENDLCWLLHDSWLAVFLWLAIPLWSQINGTYWSHDLLFLFNILNETVNRCFQSLSCSDQQPILSVNTQCGKRSCTQQTHKICEFLATLKNKQVPTCCIHQNTHCHVCSCDRR